MKYQAKIENDGKYWTVGFPDCPGCVTFGNTKSEALAMAADALSGWLAVCLDRGEVPPMPAFLDGTPIAPETTIAVAVQVRLHRHHCNMSQSKLALAAGLTQQQISKLETSKSNPTVKTLQAVSRAMGRDLLVLMSAPAPTTITHRGQGRRGVMLSRQSDAQFLQALITHR